MERPGINLKEYGIDVGLLISGLFGAILLTSKGSAMNLTRTVSSLVGGAASANYITPIVVNMAKLDDTHYHYGIAFLLGFLGLKGIEYFSSKLIPDVASEPVVAAPKTKRKKPSTRRKR
jgi:hypothetical protein